MRFSSVDSLQFENLMQRIKAGDLSARDAIVRGFFARLEWLTRKMLRSYPKVRQWENTSDVMQAAMLRLVRALDNVQPDSIRSLMNLAAVQIRRELLNLSRYYRQTCNSPVALRQRVGGNSSSANFEPPAPADDPNELARWAAAHEAVDALPDDEREVVSLVFYHGLTRLAAAELLNINEKTVRRHWKNALVKIHRKLAAFDQKNSE